jgi:hypothetical protein
MLTLAFMLVLSGLIELHCALNWNYYERQYAKITDYTIWRQNRGRNATLEQRGERIKGIGWPFILLNQFEFLTMIVAIFVAFSATLPYMLPIWILSFLGRLKRKYRVWRIFDNFACATLFFVAAMICFVGTTTNLRVG